MLSVRLEAVRYLLESRFEVVTQAWQLQFGRLDDCLVDQLRGVQEAIFFDVLKDDFGHGLVLGCLDLIHNITVLHLDEDYFVSLAMLVDRKTDVKRCCAMHVW